MVRGVKFAAKGSTTLPKMSKIRQRPFVISIEGNIGSGKSTLIKYFQKFPDVQVHPEPLEKWQNVSGENLLAKLYEDPQRWSFQFQSYVQLTRLEIAKQSMASGKDIKMIERSVQNNRFCFLELAKRTLQGPEFAVLESWYNWFEANMDLELDLIVYLRTDPEVAYHRMMERGRAEEKGGAPLSYLQDLHDRYEDWLMAKKFPESRLAPVLVIDANQSIEEVRNDCDKYKDYIRGIKSPKDLITDDKENVVM